MNARPNESLLKAIELLKSRGQTLGFAESCTGGLMSAAVASQAGVSAIYQGAVVCYSNQVKMDLLGVLEDTLKSKGAVSEEVALQMAKGVCKSLNCDWSVAITGIAGPSGGTPEKPVGTVWFAVAGPGVAGSMGAKAERQMFRGTRTEIQSQSVDFASQFLRECLDL